MDFEDLSVIERRMRRREEKEAEMGSLPAIADSEFGSDEEDEEEEVRERRVWKKLPATPMPKKVLPRQPRPSNPKTYTQSTPLLPSPTHSLPVPSPTPSPSSSAHSNSQMFPPNLQNTLDLSASSSPGRSGAAGGSMFSSTPLGANQPPSMRRLPPQQMQNTPSTTSLSTIKNPHPTQQPGSAASSRTRFLNSVEGQTSFDVEPIPGSADGGFGDQESLRGTEEDQWSGDEPRGGRSYSEERQGEEGYEDSQGSAEERGREGSQDQRSFQSEEERSRSLSQGQESRQEEAQYSDQGRSRSHSREMSEEQERREGYEDDGRGERSGSGQQAGEQYSQEEHEVPVRSFSHPNNSLQPSTSMDSPIARGNWVEDRRRTRHRRSKTPAAPTSPASASSPPPPLPQTPGPAQEDALRIPSLTRTEDHTISPSSSQNSVTSTPEAGMVPEITVTPSRGGGGLGRSYSMRSFGGLEDLEELSEEGSGDGEMGGQQFHPTPGMGTGNGKGREGVSYVSTPGMGRAGRTPSATPTMGSGASVYHSVENTVQQTPGAEGWSVKDITQPHTAGSVGLVTPKPAGKVLGDSSAPNTEEKGITASVQRVQYATNVLNSTRKPLIGRRMGRLSGGSESSTSGMESGQKRPGSRMSVAALSSAALSVLQDDRSGSFSVGETSFISVTSSADLTSDRRATSARAKGNTSMPVMMPGEGFGLDHPVDSVKIAKHLKGVNEVLSEEVRVLTQRLAKIGKVTGARVMESGEVVVGTPGQGGSQFGTPMREDGKSVGSILTPGSVEVDLSPEMAVFIEGLREEMGEKEQRVGELEQQLEEDRQVHEEEVGGLREQITAMEGGFREKIEKTSGMFKELIEAKDREFARKMKEMEVKLQDIQMANDGLKREKDRLAGVLGMEESEEKEKALKEHVDALGRELEAERQKRVPMQKELEDKDEEIKEQEQEMEALKADLQTLLLETEEMGGVVERLRKVEGSLEGLSKETKEKDAQIQQLEGQITAFQTKSEDTVRELRQRIKEVSSESEGKDEDIRILSAELEKIQNTSEKLVKELAAERQKLATKEHSHAHLQSELEVAKASLTAAKETIRQLEEAAVSDSPTTADASVRSRVGDDTKLRASESVVEQLRLKLEEAHTDVDRLRQQVAQPRPSEVVISKAQEERIEVLQQEKQQLQERITSFKQQMESKDAALAAMRSPEKGSMIMAGSPFSIASRPVNKHLLKLGTPRTPGVMPEFSMANSSFGGIDNEAIYAELAGLQSELGAANKLLDGNFAQLEAAGLRAFTVAEQLAHACDKVTQLEQELASATAKQSRAEDRLSRIKCPECDIRFDAGKLVNVDAGFEIPRAPRHPTRDDLDATVKSLRAQYEDLKAHKENDHARGVKEAEELQDALDRMNQQRLNVEEDLETQMLALKRSAKAREQLEREKQELDEECAGLRKDITLLQSSLRSKQAEVMSLQNNVDDLTAKLARAERQERAMRDENQDLQSNIDALSKRLSAQQSSKSSPGQHKLLSEIDSLKRELTASKQQLKDAERRCASLQSELQQRMSEASSTERHSTSRERELEKLRRNLAQVEASLDNHRREAERFGSDLGNIKDRQARSGVAEGELASLRAGRREAEALIASLESNIMDLERALAEQSRGTISAEQLQKQKAELIVERKKLSGQIRYLQAKFTRENAFRDALSVQKHYLVCLVGKFRKTEKETLAMIASMVQPPRPRTLHRLSFRGVVLAVMATKRMANMAADWRYELAEKDRISESHRAFKQARSRQTSA